MIVILTCWTSLEVLQAHLEPNDPKVVYIGDDGHRNSTLQWYPPGGIGLRRYADIEAGLVKPEGLMISLVPAHLYRCFGILEFAVTLRTMVGT